MLSTPGWLNILEGPYEPCSPELFSPAMLQTLGGFVGLKGPVMDPFGNRIWTSGSWSVAKLCCTKAARTRGRFLTKSSATTNTEAYATILEPRSSIR